MKRNTKARKNGQQSGATLEPRDEAQASYRLHRTYQPKLTQQQLETHLWGAANILRGKTAGQDYKNYILSLMFYKRLCDQWENEADEAIAELERQQGRSFTESEKSIFRSRGEHRFTIPAGSRWGDVKAVSTNIGQTLTQAMRAVSDANDELRGVFTVDWNQPAPDSSGKPLIPNQVVHALIQHFDEVDLSNRSVPPDVLGRAYEYLIKQFADDAGAKAGEFFTPPEVVDVIVRILEPHPGDTIYDPTCGSGGMLVHAGDFLREHHLQPTSALYYGQEMNWSNAAIGKINSVLHGLEAEIKAGASTITDPQFVESNKLKQFSLIMANFPFSDEFWWLRPEQQTDDKKKREKLKKEIFTKEGYKDTFGRFGRGTSFASPPAGFGDYAFILHIFASLSAGGRAGIVCPQGILFRGQPEHEEETGEYNKDGAPIIKRRKADSEHLIRRGLVDARAIDAIIALPQNIFYGAGLPACLVILRKDRHQLKNGTDDILLVYAARHYRELSAQNELRPQDVMRILVHYHAYGKSDRVADLVAEHSTRLLRYIDNRQEDETARVIADYEKDADTVSRVDAERTAIQAKRAGAKTKKEKDALGKALKKFEALRAKAVSKIAERDKKLLQIKSKAQQDRRDIEQAGAELVELYTDPDELRKHARVVKVSEIEENDFNLNIPRYVDTFEPEEPIDVNDALQSLQVAETALESAEHDLSSLLKAIGYAR